MTRERKIEEAIRSSGELNADPTFRERLKSEFIDGTIAETALPRPRRPSQWWWVALPAAATAVLFVVMLLNLRTDAFPPGRSRLLKLGAALVGVVLLAELRRVLGPGLPEPPPLPDGFGSYRQVGIALYTDYLLLVEMASLLLLAAIVGALILAKREID